MNPSKCHVLPIGQVTSSPQYFLNGSPLECVEYARDLGIIITRDLKPSEHCKFIYNRAMRQLYCLFKCITSRDPVVLTFAYCTYIRPLLESASPAFSPYLKRDVKLIERVQNVFTRRLFFRCKPQECSPRPPGPDLRRNALSLPSLEFRRLLLDLSLCFKMSRGTMVSSCKFTCPSGRTRRSSSSFFFPFCRKDVRKHSFMIRAARFYSRLPHQAQHAPSHFSFRNAISKLDLASLCS